MIEKTDNPGKLEISLRILGNELIGLKMEVDDFKIKWMVLGIMSVITLAWAVTEFGPLLIDFWEQP